MPDPQAIAAGFDARRNALIQRLLAPVAPDARPGDIYGNHTVARLAQGVDLEDANRRLRHVAQWFDHPHPWGRDHLGEPDFVAQKLAFAYLKFDGPSALEPATRDAIRAFFLTRNFQSKYNSENHDLIFRAMRCLMGHALPDDVFQHWGRKGRDLASEDLAWLAAFFRYRAARGWAEFDSSCYMLPDVEAMLALHEFAPDPTLARLAEMSLNLVLADMAVDSIGGFHGGAQGRIYGTHATDHSTTGSFLFHHLYFDAIDPRLLHPSHLPIECLATRFRPHPLVIELAVGRKTPYVNRERKHLHNMADVMPAHPLEGSIRKITRWNPDYLLGAVQKQDPYPASVSDWTRGYAFHQQHDWDLTFPTHPRARIFAHHPGNFDQHSHWTGDQRCGCGRYFQHGSALLALHHIPEGEPFQFIHAYVPRDAFDEVVEESGWIFVRAGDGYGALKLLRGYEWVTQGPWANQEVRTPPGVAGSARDGVICEAGCAADHGDFGAFRRAVLACEAHAAPDLSSITYQSTRDGKLTLGPGQHRGVDGVDADLDYPTYGSPYLNSAWNSGVVTLTLAGRTLRWNFPAATWGENEV